MRLWGEAGDSEVGGGEKLVATSIEWTDETWNCVRGCSMAPGSEKGGCLNCYAARQAARDLPEMRSPTTGEPFATFRKSGPRWTGDVELIPSKLDEPLRWRKPRRVFVNSMSALFHEALPYEDVLRVWSVMAQAERHTFQVLTKRPGRMREFVTEWTGGLILPHVWLGVSVEDQATADERIPLLLQTPAAVRFVSYEPALGPVDFSRWMWPMHWHWDAKFKTPEEALAAGASAERRRQALVSARRNFLDQIIVGGESGPGARPFDLAWARSVIRQCREAGVACFVKQLGACILGDFRFFPKAGPPGLGALPMTPNRGGCHVKDPKGGDPSEWPEDLRVREFPA